jgi:hypothetical protein
VCAENACRVAHEEAEERHRQELRERERADRHGRVRQLQDEPRRRDLLHPRARERDRLPDEVEPVVPVLAHTRERPAADVREGVVHSKAEESIG